MGLFSDIASIFSGGQKAKAAKQAADAQVAAAQKGIDQINTNQGLGLDALNTGRDTGLAALTGQQGTNRDDLSATLAALMPFITGGQQAVGAQGDLLGLNGNDPQAAAIASLKDSPLFKSLFQTGDDNILANASATGGLRGGNVQNSLARFGSDTLSQVIQNQLTNLSGLTSTGLTATGQAGGARSIADQLGTTLAGGQAPLSGSTGSGIAQLLANSGLNISQLFGDQGAAQAGGILGKLQGHMQQNAGVTGAIGDIAAAFLPIPGAGGTGIGQTISKII